MININYIYTFKNEIFSTRKYHSFNLYNYMELIYYFGCVNENKQCIYVFINDRFQGHIDGAYILFWMCGRVVK